MTEVLLLEFEGADDLELGQIPLGDAGVNLLISLLSGILDDVLMEELGYPSVAERLGDEGNLEIEFRRNGAAAKGKYIVHPVDFRGAERRITDEKTDDLFFHQGNEGFILIPRIEVAFAVVIDSRLDPNALKLFSHFRLELLD